MKVNRPPGSAYVDGNGHMLMAIGEVHQLAKHTIVQKIDDLTNALEIIAKTLEGLELGWAGEAKNEAQRLLDRWSDVSGAIFGTKKDPDKGVVARLAGGLVNATFSYNQTENLVESSWAKLRDDLTMILAGSQHSGGDGSGGDAQTPPISEV